MLAKSNSPGHCLHTPTMLQNPITTPRSGLRSTKTTICSQLHPPHSPTGESHHQTVKRAKGENTDFESRGEPSQKNLGAFVKGGVRHTAQTSDDLVSQLQKDVIPAVCMQARALYRRRGLGRGDQEERQTPSGV